MKSTHDIEIEKEGGRYVATGEGLVATGKTRKEAYERLLYEIDENRKFYKEVLGDEAEIIMKPHYLNE